MHGFHRLALALMLACLCATSSLAGTVGKFEGWELEQGVDLPSYAVIEPQSTDLNIDSVVLACEQAIDRRILQLQIYPSTEGPLLPKGVLRQQLKDDPRAEIAIDGRIFPVGILFADDYAVLVAELAGQPDAFDGEAVIALQAGSGGNAVSAVRRCATTARVVSARHDRH